VLAWVAHGRGAHAQLVTHEPAHLTESRHTPAFWARVERVRPDFAARKQWLAKHGWQASAP
jgi:predicted metal-dependent hydrolase